MDMFDHILSSSIMMKNNNKGMKNKKNNDKVQEKVDPTLETGNYIIEVVSNGEVIKKIAVANSEIYIKKLATGGLTVDLK